MMQGRPLSLLSLEGGGGEHGVEDGSGLCVAGAAVFGKTTGRSMGGDGDECLTWCAGERNVNRHDGRTGLPMIPSIEVLARLGELSPVSTNAMQQEFNLLMEQENRLGGRGEEGKGRGGKATKNREWRRGVALDKGAVASQEWLRARGLLYSSSGLDIDMHMWPHMQRDESS